MDHEHLHEHPPVPDKHRALDGYRAGSDRLVARIGDALSDVEDPILVTKGRRPTTLSALEERISAVLDHYDRKERS